LTVSWHRHRLKHDMTGLKGGSVAIPKPWMRGIQGNGSHQKEGMFNLKLKKRNESRRGFLMDDADWKRWVEAGPFKKSSGQIVEIHPEGIGPHSSFDEYFSVERWRSCDQGHRYMPNLVERSGLVIPQSCEAQITL
jgi:hypothetical protein